ncbi:hypothetical protein [Sulfurospirillum cavolei]|uniref:hypothetical protein n=1 Tax=Sulfurospirillum cavolei TaxID=366522 RepID=UPI003FA1F95A
MNEIIKEHRDHCDASFVENIPTKHLCDAILWHNKPLRMGSFLVWDVENIGVRFMEEIKASLSFTPQKRYALSKRPLSLRVQNTLQKEGFILFEHYPLSVDEKIMKLIHLHQGYTHGVLVSSDSDFVPTIKSFLENHHVVWIMRDDSKKRICMYMDLTHPRLTLRTLFRSSSKKHSSYCFLEQWQ